MTSPTPRIEAADAPDGALAVLGAWTAADLTSPPVWKAVTAQLKSLNAKPDTPWNLSGIDKLDFLGAQVLWNHWGRQWPANLTLEPRQRALMASVEKFAMNPPVKARPGWLEPIAVLGRRLLSAFDHATGLVRLVGQLLLDLLRLLRHPQEGPWRDFSGHLYSIGATALPITALVGFLIGVVLAYLISQQLKQFGADAFIVNILGISLIRELGPVLAAILIAGRSGSAITAQIGVMRVMGIAHGYRLVMPRALALAIVMPLISVWTTVAALLGGMMAATAAMGITPSYFTTRCLAQCRWPTCGWRRPSRWCLAC